MLVQNPPFAVRYNSTAQQRSQLQFSGSSKDSDTFSLGQGNSSKLIPTRPATTRNSNSLFKLFQKNLKKQESATERMQRQIEQDVQTQEKERKRVLKDIYYLVLEYSRRTELEHMLVNGYRKADISQVNYHDASILYAPVPVKGLKLEEEIPAYDLSLSKRSKIYEDVQGRDKHGHCMYRLPLQESSKRTYGIQQDTTVDDMGHLLISPLRIRESNGELHSHDRLYPNDLNGHFAFKHPTRTVRDITSEERKMLHENREKRNQLEADIEKLKAERLDPIDKKLDGYQKDLIALAEAAAEKPAQYTDRDDTQ